MVVKSDLLIRRGFPPGEFASMAALAVRAWRIAARGVELTADRQHALEAKAAIEANSPGKPGE
ncbi:hypothetical protein Q644_24365 [Brucella intermedia 229E]|uniref:Uncharacterized protein n=1 Tax=Brucella intermedia 229E TaxID=1337887 RepID=U4V8C3_9HYPH|nr:hypothetical protein Q644_24365 [Brucella intermedia 229E]